MTRTAATPGRAQDGLQDLPGTSELITNLSEIEGEQRKILERLEDLEVRLMEEPLK